MAKEVVNPFDEDAVDSELPAAALQPQTLNSLLLQGAGTRESPKLADILKKGTEAGRFVFKTGVESLGILGGAKAGALAGATLGPLGVAAGGLGGAGLGALLSNLAAQKAEQLTGITEDKPSLKEAVLTGALSTIAGPAAKGIGIAGKLVSEKALKPAANLLGIGTRKVLASLRGVSDDTAKTFLKNPEAVIEVEKLGGSTALAEEVATNYNSAKSKFLKDTQGKIQSLLESTDKKVDISDVISKYSDRLKTLKSEFDPGAKSLESELTRLRAVLSQNQGSLSGKQLLRQKNLSQEAAEFIDPTKAQIGRSAESEKALRELSRDLNKKLDEYSPSIREMNKKLSNLILAEKRLGIKREVDPKQADALLTSIGARAKKAKLQESELKTIQETLGIDLNERGALSKAVQELAQGDMFSTLKTGRALLGAGGGFALGGAPGAGIGLLLSSPQGFRAALRAGQITKPVINAFVNAPGAPKVIIDKISKAPLELKASILATFIESPAGQEFQKDLSGILNLQENLKEEGRSKQFNIRNPFEE